MSTDSPSAAPPAPEPPRFVRELDTLIRARYSLIYLVSWEEQRLDVILEDLARSHGKTLCSWSITGGLRKMVGSRWGAATDGTKDPGDALRAILALPDPSLVVLKDFHPFLNDPVVVRSLRDLAHQLKTTYTTVILLSPVLNIPVELEKDVSVLDVPLPTFHDLGQLVREIVTTLRKNNRVSVQLDRGQGEQLIKAALGLTLSEAENAFAKAMATDDRLDVDDIQLILEEKRQVIRKSGLLEYYPAEESLAGIGGLENLKRWLDQPRDRVRGGGAPLRPARAQGPPAAGRAGLRQEPHRQGGRGPVAAAAAAPRHRAHLLGPRRLVRGEPAPRHPGGGERGARGPLDRRDREGALRHRVLGHDRQRRHRAHLRRPPHLAAGEDGAGVRGRHRQPHREPAARAAAQGPLRRDLLRGPARRRRARGDLRHPSASAAAATPRGYDTAELARMAEGFSGAEIEQAVVAGLYHAFAGKVELAQDHLREAIGETVPLATTMKEEIDRLRSWARPRTRPASLPQAGSPSAPLASRFA